MEEWRVPITDDLNLGSAPVLPEAARPSVPTEIPPPPIVPVRRPVRPRIAFCPDCRGMAVGWNRRYLRHRLVCVAGMTASTGAAAASAAAIVVATVFFATATVVYSNQPEPDARTAMAAVLEPPDLPAPAPPDAGPLPPRPPRVVIDAGHGGPDAGTIGPTGLIEKDLVLDIARRLAARIESRLRAEVILTREADLFLPLETRTALANAVDADLFISIHANSSRNRAARGVETYFLNPAEGARLAGDGEAIAVEGGVLDESRRFAAHVQHALARSQEFGEDRGVKQAPFAVLLGAGMPSILAEVSFLSNPDDERLLRGEERRDEIAEALFQGVQAYSETAGGM